MYRSIGVSRPQRFAAQAQRSPVTDAASVAALTRLIDQKIADATASPHSAASTAPQRRNLWLRGDLLQSAPTGRRAPRTQRRRRAPLTTEPRRQRSRKASQAAHSAGRVQRASTNRLRLALTWLLTSALMLATAATAYELLNPALLPAQARISAPAAAVSEQVLPADAAPAAVGANDGAALVSQVQALREDNVLLQDRITALRAKLTNTGANAEQQP